MDRKLIQQLVDALQEASDHLEYCGYGDNWERECALEAKLPQKIELALEAGNDALNQ